MTVTDLHGCPIEVTDVTEAISQCFQYKEYRYEDCIYSDFDKRRRAYWQDLYEKLVGIQNNSK